MELHIIPEGDTSVHEPEWNCECHPRRYYIGDCVLWLHNASDGRYIPAAHVEEIADELNYGCWDIR